MNAETVIAASTGDLRNKALLWRYRKGVPHVSPPFLYNGVLYLVREGSIVTSLNAKSGEPGRQARISSAPGDYYASPVGAEDKIYTERGGETRSLEAWVALGRTGGQRSW